MLKEIYGLLIILLMLSCVSGVIAGGGGDGGVSHNLVSPVPSSELQAAIDNKYAS
jgi:hypothetical protein